jgi:hypothetical protein
LTGEFPFLRLHRIALLQVKEIKQLLAHRGAIPSNRLPFAHG